VSKISKKERKETIEKEQWIGLVFDHQPKREKQGETDKERDKEKQNNKHDKSSRVDR
jgi:hypothetical protein